MRGEEEVFVSFNLMRKCPVACRRRELRAMNSVLARNDRYKRFVWIRIREQRGNRDENENERRTLTNSEEDEHSVFKLTVIH